MTASNRSAVDMLKPLFSVRDLTLTMESVRVCEHLDFEVYPGEMVAILGRNGVGKSTLLSALAGFPRGDVDGEILLGGQSYTTLGHKAAACWRGVLTQKQQDQFSSSVLETVMTGRHPHLGRWSWESVEDKEVALASLQQVGMADFAARDVMTLSGGERQRVALATILAQTPTLYFMDEPLTHLDLNHQIELLNLIRNKAHTEQVSCIMVLHEPGLAYRYCDSALLLLGEGQWQYGSVDSMLTADNLSHLYGYPLRQLEQPNAQGVMQRWFVPT